MSSMNLTLMPFVDVILIITLTTTIPCQGYYFMSLWAWVWIGGHEQVSKIKSLLEFFSHVDKRFKVYFVVPRTWYLVTWKNILPHVMDEWYLWMKMWMKNDNGWKFSWTFAIGYISNKIQKNYVGLLWIIQHMKCSNYTWTSISNSMTTKYNLALQHPNHIKIEIKSNSMAHKLVDPPRGMCQFKHYMSTTKRYATIRNWNNIRHFMTPYHFKLSFIFICSHNPLATYTKKLHSFILLLICMQNTSICIICMGTS
jgi:hypothetical protein